MDTNSFNSHCVSCNSVFPHFFTRAVIGWGPLWRRQTHEETIVTAFLNCTLQPSMLQGWKAVPSSASLKAWLKNSPGYFPVWRTQWQLFIAHISFILPSPPQRKYKLALAIGMDIIQHQCALKNSTGRVTDTMKGKVRKMQEEERE